MANWDLIIKGLAAGGGVSSAVFAAYTYYRSTRTKAAEFLVSLHKAFFVDPIYQAMKALLDSEDPGDEAKLETAVRDESAEFTDFLNFFELVAYLSKVGTLSDQDVNALLGYYLDKLRSKASVWAYIGQSSRGFENLRRLLTKRPIQ